MMMGEFQSEYCKEQLISGINNNTTTNYLNRNHKGYDGIMLVLSCLKQMGQSNGKSNWIQDTTKIHNCPKRRGRNSSQYRA